MRVNDPVDKRVKERCAGIKRALVAVSASVALGASSLQAAEPSVEEKLQILQRELDQLKAQIDKLRAAAPAAGAATAAAPAPARGSYSAAPSTSVASPYGVAGLSTPAASGSTTIGGYGEFNYNRYRNRDTPSKADLRRFVLFFGHQFNDRLRFQSELEVEHAVVSKDDHGEVELEQAFLDYRINDAFNVKAGLFLIPLGILNETHEPPTYFGVERNEVETRIIPTTWREGGLGLHGVVGPGFNYDVGITTGFDAGKFDDPSVGIRSAHQELQLANATDLSWYGALNYRGTPGVLLGGGVFSGDTGQNGASNAALKGVSGHLTLWDVHGKYRHGDLDLQALYARGTLGDADKISAATGTVAPGAFFGWYGQAAYHLWKFDGMELAPFVRYERFNTQQRVAAGLVPDPLNNERVVTAGLNFYLHPQVVLKADYQKFRGNTDKDRVNLGLGYMF